MKYLLAAACSLYSLSAFCQVFPPADYPKGYFRDPLGIPIKLAANFGELRPNHFHMGLDIRTEKKENLPVYAAADGYISRVVIEPGGFGQAIYINHPNGYTTLYAHLNKFMPALAAFVKERQYRAESWKTNLEISPGRFPVRKGEQVAFSGNTGGSQGPHLHFEIRKTAGDINLNPLLFGLPVPDNTAPVIQRLAVYDRSKSIYEQSPRFYPVQRAAISLSGAAGPVRPGGYAVPGLIKVSTGRVSFAISAFDTQSGSANPNGIFQAVLYDNDLAVIGFQMDHISYDNTRNLNAHIDYKTRETGGPYLQNLSLLPGYPPPTIYRSFRQNADRPELPADGVVDLSDGNIHAIRIEVKDAYGNTSTLEFRVQSAPVSAGGGSASSEGAGSTPPEPEPAGRRFFPGMLDGYESTDCAFYLGEKSLYDTIHIAYSVSGYPGAGISLPGAVSAVHTIGAPYIPLLDPVLVRIRPIRDTPEKVVMVWFNGSKKEVQRPEWQGGWASARFRQLGNFQLVQDLEPPLIIPSGIYDGANLRGMSRIAFTIKDNLGAIRNFRAELDPAEDGSGGKWLCFTNDKGLAFIYTFDEHCPSGTHILKVTAEDEAGNRSTASYRFTR